MDLKFDVVVTSVVQPNHPDGQDLTSLNGRIHDLLDEWLVSAIEAITALDMAAAARAWNCLMWHVEAHHRAEDALILCRYEAADGSSAPECAQAELFHSEHKRLQELMNQCMVEIERIDQSPAHKRRRRMVERLEVFLRVRRLLEQHGLREQTHLYPSLDARLPADERSFIAEELEASSL